jgi:hypothetical protein
MESKIYTNRITSVAALKSAIRVLEVEQVAKETELKEQFYLTYESLKPVNILRNTIKELFSSSSRNEDFSGTAVGAAGGYLVKKLLVGSSGSLLRKLIGTALQIGMTNFASHKSETIKLIGQSLLQRIFRRKNRRSDNSVS